MSDLDDLISEIETAKPEASAFVDRMIADERTEQTGTNGDENRNQSADHSSPPSGFPVAPVFSSGKVEENHTVFDPEIHSIGEDGKPRLNQDGSFRKKRGRKKGSTNSHFVDTSQATFDLECSNCATLTVQTFIVCGYALGGEEWKAEDAEKFAMIEAWKAYYKAKGCLDLPPWIGVAIATGAYALPRFNKPITKSRLQQVWGVVKPFGKRVLSWFGFGRR